LGDTEFHFANALQILVHLMTIGGTDLRMETLGVVEHQVEHALLSRTSPRRRLIGSLIPRTEQPIEQMLRIRLLAVGMSLAAPRNAMRVGTAVARVARPGETTRLAADFERRELGRLPQILGSDLI